MKFLSKLFVTYVRPILEYCSVSSPHRIDLINRLEDVQRRFTKKLNGLANLSYAKRLEILGPDCVFLLYFMYFWAYVSVLYYLCVQTSCLNKWIWIWSQIGSGLRPGLGIKIDDLGRASSAITHHFRKFIPIFQEISGKFPEICTGNFPPVQTFQITIFAYIFILLAFRTPLVSRGALIITLKHCFRD